MLFEGWALQFAPDAWRGHPLSKANNVNGIDGDANGDGKGVEVHTLTSPKVTALQEAYVRKVVDTLGDLDNVLYEISNENHPPSTKWQYHMIDLVHNYEKTKPKQHPVGMTFQYRGGSNRALFESPADWISPNSEYVVYLPKGGDVTVDLGAANGKVQLEWLDPTGGTTRNASGEGGGKQRFESPFAGAAVLHVRPAK